MLDARPHSLRLKVGVRVCVCACVRVCVCVSRVCSFISYTLCRERTEERITISVQNNKKKKQRETEKTTIACRQSSRITISPRTRRALINYERPDTGFAPTLRLDFYYGLCAVVFTNRVRMMMMMMIYPVVLPRTRPETFYYSVCYSNRDDDGNNNRLLVIIRPTRGRIYTYLRA